LDWIQVKWLGFVSNLALKACVLDLKCEFLCSNCVSPIAFCTAGSGRNGFGLQACSG
jgi:hypothetical protein